MADDIDYTKYGYMPEVDYTKYGMAPNSAHSNSIMDTLGNVAGAFNNAVETARVPAFAGGILQGGGDIGTSIANIPLQTLGMMIGKDLRIPHPNLGKYIDDSLPSKIAFGSGEAVPNVLGGIGAANAVSKMSNLSKIPYIGGAIARPLEGAATGAALGEDQEGNRGIASVIGGAANPIMATLKYASGLMPKGLAQTILSAKNSAKEKYSDIYNGLFNEAKQSGLSDIPLRIPKIDLDLIKQNSAGKYWKTLQNFHENPSLENAHIAQSDMNKLAGHLDKLQRNNPLSSTQIRTYEEALEAVKKIRGSMFAAFTKQGDQTLANKYGEATRGYAKDVVPYNKSKAITDLQNKTITEKTFADKIAKDQRFRLAMDETHPEIAHSEILRNMMELAPKVGKYGLAAALGGAAGGGAINYYKD